MVYLISDPIRREQELVVEKRIVSWMKSQSTGITEMNPRAVEARMERD